VPRPAAAGSAPSPPLSSAPARTALACACDEGAGDGERLLSRRRRHNPPRRAALGPMPYGKKSKLLATMWMTPSSTLSSRCDLPMGESRPGKQDKSISCFGGLCANSLGSESLYCTD